MKGPVAWRSRAETVWRRRARLTDALLATGCAFTTTGPAMDSTLFAGSPYLNWHPPVAVTVPLAALIGAGTLLRRRWPVALVTAGIVGWMIAAAYPAVILGQYTLGAQVRSRRVVVAATIAVTAAVAVPFWQQGLDSILPLTVAICLAPTLLGLWVASRRELLSNLRERTERAERAQQLAADRARAEERARIAHDMHDVVAHRVSLMVLHATAADVAVESERTTLIRRIRSIGREALDELRSLVGVLRTDDVPLMPQPTLTDLPALIEQSTQTGMSVALTSTGQIERLPVLIEQAGYRVVQEALTNVHKHAGPTCTRVQLHYEPDRLALTISNEPANTSVDPLPAGGHGLIGLDERIRLLGGRLIARPRSDGGFEVIADIPVVPGSGA
jgi:signal transduction histidine kinase